jgi:hypothetical protein
MDRLSTWSPQLRERAARHIAAFKGFRHLLDGDYRVLSVADDPLLSDWDAWEFSDPASGEAVLVAFRLRSAEARRRFDGTRAWDVELPYEGAGTWHVR